MDLISKIKLILGKSLNDDQGWFRQGKFTPVKQVQDIRRQQAQMPVTMFGPLVVPNFRNQQVQQQFKPLTQPFQKFGNQALLAGQTFASVPLQAVGINYGPSTSLIKKVQEAGMLSQQGKIGGKELWNSVRNTADVALKTYGLANPINATRSMVAGAGFGGLANTVSNIIGKKPITSELIQATQQGGVQGLANAGTMRLTNSIVEKASKFVPAFRKLTDTSIAKGVPTVKDTLKVGIQKWANTLGKRLIKAAVLETMVETPVWATLTQSDKETFMEAVQREFISNLGQNLAFAGIGSLGDATKLAPIVKQTLDNSINKYWKYASSPEGLKAQMGSVRLPKQTLINKTNIISSPSQLKGVEGQEGAIKTTSVKLPTSLKTQQQLQNLSPDKTSPLMPEETELAKISDYPSPDINTNRLNITTRSKDFVNKTVEEVKPQIESVIGKKLSNKEAVSFADNSAKVLNRVVTRQETLAWESKMLKARQLLAKQAKEGKVTQEYIDNLIAIKSQGTDIARKLQSLSVGADAKEVTAKQAILEAVMNVTKDTDTILKKAKGVDFNDYEQAASFYREFVKPKIGDWMDKIRYSSMLSSPNTHINNFSSNFQGTGIITPIEKTIAGGVDKLASALRPGRHRQQYSGEGLAYAKGYYANVSNAWKKFTDTLSGKTLSSTQEMYNLPLSTKGTGARKIEDVLGYPSRLLQAVDEFFQTLTSKGVESSLKYRQSKGIKISGIEDKAFLESRKRLFNSEFGLKEEGPLLKAIEFIPQKVSEARANPNPVISTIAKYTFPFVRVPSNIFKASMEYSPLGVGTIPGASNKIEQLAKAILGTSIGLTTATLVSGDNMTWSEPVDEKKRNAFRAAGMQPYSIRIGDKWYSYSKMHPAIAFNLAMVAAIRDAEKNKTLDDNQIDVLLNGLVKWVNFYADMSYVKNLGDAVSGVKGDINAGTRQVSNYLQQLIPFRALMGWVARLVDPYQRQVDVDGTILQKQLQQLQMQIPLLSQSVPVRLDSKGNPIENQNRVINALSPIRITNVVPQAESIYKGMVTRTINTKNENIVKDRVSRTGREEIYNGKKYYPSFKVDSKTGEKIPIVKSVKVTQSMNEIYRGLRKEYQVSDDAPTNFVSKIITYGKGLLKDPKGTINAVKTGQPIRKIRGDAVIVERLKGLDSLDRGDQATQVDHIIALALGGTNDESNLQIISEQDNQVKGVVDTYLANLLEEGKITKKEAQQRDLNWRNEIANLPDRDKNKIAYIMAKEPSAPTNKIDTTILSILSNREYKPIYNEETKTYSNIGVKIPEPPKLSGQTELDKSIRSKYLSALSTAKNNITKLYLDGQITAKEAEEALNAIKKARTNGGSKKSKKSKKIKISRPSIKMSAVKVNNIPLKGISGLKTPLVKSYGTKNIKIAKPKLNKIAIASETKKTPPKVFKMPTIKIAKGGFLT